MPDETPNPAQQAAQEAWTHLKSCIEQRESFIFEAGAGAGKTYSLIEALRYLIEKEGIQLLRNHQQIACITYTNVATNEIETRTDRHPAIYSSTIHAFCWTLIKGFQPFLRKEIPNIPKWPERLKESVKRLAERAAKERIEQLGEKDADNNAIIAQLVIDLKQLEAVGNRNVEYSLGHPKADRQTISLGHNDVLILAAKLLENEKFRRIMVNRFPIIFIDEYQDTDNLIVESLKANVFGKEGCPLIGFFGDHWQKIYGAGCGAIHIASLKRIGKKANFRSAPAIVNCLNRMRPELPQAVKDPSATGSVAVFHTNNWNGQRRPAGRGGHWEGDLPETEAHSYLEKVTSALKQSGWDFAPRVSKILMLTHNVLAAEQGYQQLAAVFSGRNDDFIKKEDPHIAFLVDIVEPVCAAFLDKKYGEMFAVIGGRTRPIHSHSDKAAWSAHLTDLVALRQTGSIGAVMDFLRKGQLIPVPEAVETKERVLKSTPQPQNPDGPDGLDYLRQLRNVPYKQIATLSQFIDEKTPFSTKHGVKGAEFENVLAIFGRGWNQYNFGQFLDWEGTEIPIDKTEAYERNRNLFYVACSRPRKRLALLFTQELPPGALVTLAKWFETAAIHSLPNI